MTRWVEEILRRYGQEVTVEHGGETETVRAFLQPVRAGDEAPGEPGAAGWLDRRRWLYLGQRAVEAGDTVLWKGRRFRVRGGRPHYIGAGLSHWRAVLERARETE